MSRSLAPLTLIALCMLLPACQGNGPRQSPAASAAEPAPSPHTFDSDTIQTYDLQTGQYQQQPPFGARSNRSQ